MVETESGCWEWQRATIEWGYGYVRFQGQLWLVHRLTWTLLRGRIPRGLKVLHRCDNPPCGNPEHLFVGTDADNSRDMSAKGRGMNGRKLPSVSEFARNRPRRDDGKFILGGEGVR